MKNKNFLKKLTASILGFVMTLGVGAAGYAASAGETRAAGPITLTVNTFKISGTGYASKTATVESVTFNADNCNNNSGLCMKASTGAIYNSTALPGNISSIQLNGIKFSSSSGAGFYVYGGTSSKATTKELYNNTGATSDYTVNFSGNSYKYFYIKNKTSRTCAFQSIVISYESGFTVTYNANKPSSASGSVTNMPNPSTFSGVTTHNISSTIPKLDDYTFDGWATSTSGAVAYQPGASTGTLSDNLDLFAHWTKNFTVTDNISNGSLDDTSSISPNGELFVTIEPNDGYMLPSKDDISVSMGTVDISGDILYDEDEGSIYYENITGNITITATCPEEVQGYDVSWSGSTNVSISGPTKLYPGESKEYTVTAASNCKSPEASDVSVTGANASYNKTAYNSATLTLSGVSGAVTISIAGVALANYDISYEGEHYTHDNVSTIKEFGQQIITLTAAEHYDLPNTVSVSGVASENVNYVKTTGKLTISNPTGNVTVSVTPVERNHYTISVVGAGDYSSHFSYSGHENGIYATETAQITISPDTSTDDIYVINSSNIVVSGATKGTYNTTNHELTISNPTGAVTITVTPVIKVLNSIAVTTQPTKTSYNSGDTLNTAGLVVTATYTTGTETVSTSDLKFSQTKLAVVGTAGTAVNETIYVYYGGKSTSFSVSVTPVATGASGWNLVSNVSKLENNDKIIIAAKDYAYAISSTQNSNNRAQASITKSSDGKTATLGTGVQEITLVKNNNNTYSFSCGTSGYLYAASSSSNYLRTQKDNDDNSKWTISISDDIATITASGSNTRNVMQYNSGNNPPMFSCYGSASQKALCIYKYEQGATKTGVAINASYPTGEYRAGDTIDVSKISATLVNNDGSSTAVTSGLSINPSTFVEGTHEYTVSYSTYSTVIQIAGVQPAATMTGIELDTDSVTKTFTVGGGFNHNNLIVYGVYSAGPKKEIKTGYSVSSPNMSIAGTKTVTVSYQGFEATYDIEVSDKPVITLVSDAEINGYVGETYDIQVTLDNFSGTPSWVLNPTSSEYYEISDVSSSTTGYSAKLTISKTCKDVELKISEANSGVNPVTVTISGRANVIESITATHSTTKQYQIGETLDKSCVTVTPHYTNGSTEPGISVDDCTFTYNEDAFLKAGTPTITVTHTASGKTDEFTVTVYAKEIETTTSYIKVTDLTSLKAGDRIVIAAAESDFALSTSQNSNNRGQAAITKSGNNITWTGNAVQIITLKDGAVSGTFAMEVGTDAYLYAASSSSNYLRTKASIDSDGSWEFKDSNSIVAKGTNTHNIMQYNQSSSCFSAYDKTSQKAITVYKEESSSSDVKELAGITATYNHAGSEYHTGDSVVASDFTVKAWYDDGSTTDNVSGFTIENPSLVEGNNNIHLSYTDGSTTKDCYVAVNGITTRTATVDHVYVVAGTGYKQNYYLKSGETPAWDFSNIKVVAYYTDESTSEINLADFVNIEGNSVTHSVPTLNDKSFTVSGSYQGMAIDSSHNSVAVNVVNYGISGLDTWRLSTNFSFKVMEGEKFDLANLGSVKLTYNDGTVESAQNVETLINQGKITLGLYSGTVTKDVTPDVTVTKDTVWDSDWDGYRMAISAGSGFTDKNNSFRVVPLLNEIIAESDTPATQELTTDILSGAGMVSSYDDSDKTIKISGITYHYKNAKADGGLKIFKESSKEKYFYNSDPFSGAITKVEITEQYDNAYVKASTDGINWDVIHSATGNKGSQTIDVDATKNYKYIYFTSISSYDANMSKVVVTYRGQGNIANTNLNGQDVATAFAKDFLANGTSENWSSMATSLSTAINALSTQAEKDNAANLLKYATANADGDIVQEAVAKYDQIIADYNLVSNDFLGRDIEATDHVITFDANGGSCSVESITMNNNTTYTNLPTPTRDHYLFDGWYTKKTAGVKVENGDTFDSASSITLYAHWTYKYDVTLDVNATDASGGSLSASYYLKDSENDQYITITDPSRDGYTLTGYKITAENATLSGNTITIPAGTGGNIKVTAQWSANAHTVTLNYDNGADPVIIDTYYDEKVDLSKYSPTKTGYTLSGWKDANGTEYGLTQVIEVKGDMSLTAQWTANKYTAIFDVNGGNPLAVNTKTVTYGQALGELPTPTKDHYVFLGWYPTKTTEVDPVTGETIYLNTKDTTYYARWAYVYDVVFNYNAEDATGGTLTATNYAVNKNNDQYITITADPVREGYTVSGYTVTSEHATIDGNVITIPASTGGKITINVQWVGDPYTVTLNYDNGTSAQNIDVFYGDSFDLSSYSPTKTGYTLSGWKDSNGSEYGLNGVITIQGNISLTAQWTGNPYVISFDGNGGSTPSNIDVRYGDEIESLPESTLEHYTFLGWFTEKDGGTQVKVDDVYNTDGNTTLYAHWEANKHTVVINGVERDVGYDNQIVLDNEPTEVKEGGYFFNGWVCDADNQLYEGGATYTMPDKNVSFSAQWIKTIDNTITVTTQANFTYKYTVAGGFQEVTGYSLRMYVSLDEVSYKYYIEHGYTFTINFINNGNGQVQILRNVPVWYDGANDCYVFDIGVKIPATKLDTSLGVELVATPSSGDTCTSNTVDVTYMEAAQALHDQYEAGTVELNEEQVDALESILGMVDAE